MSDLTDEDRYIIRALLYQLCNTGEPRYISPAGGHHGGIAISAEAIRELAVKVGPSKDSSLLVIRSR